MKRRAPPLKAALLGLDHPHSPYLLRTLQNLKDVSGIFVWSETRDWRRRLAPADRGKIELITDDLSALLDRTDLAFAVVCLRHDLAAAVAARVLRAGKALLLEKPGGLNSSQLVRLDRLARERGIKAAVLYGQRAHPAVQEARRQVAAGALGPLLAVEARMITTQVRFRDPHGWLFRRATSGGGILTWLGCHYFDLIPYLLGDPITEVSAQLATRCGESIDVEDTAMLALRFASGAVGTFHAGYLLANRGSGYRNPGGFDNYLACSGRDGCLVWHGTTSNFLQIEAPPATPGGAVLRKRFWRLRKSDSYGGMVGETFVRHFIAAVRDEGQLPSVLADAVRAVRIVEAAQRSAFTQRIQTVKAYSTY